MITPHGDPLGRIGEPDIGGQCVYVRELSAELAAAGVSVTAFTRDREDGRPPRESIAPGAEVVRVPCGPPGFIPKEELLPHLDEFAADVRRHLAGGEVIHSHYWDGAYVAGRLRPAARWIHTSHSIGKLKQAALPDGGQYRYAERIAIESDAYRSCDRVVALTDRERSEIAELYDLPPDRITVIPPGVNPDRFVPSPEKSAVRRELGLPDARTVFALGRLDERKGFDLYFRAVHRLLEHRDLPTTSFLLSAGGGSPTESHERARLERMRDELSIARALTWLPVLPEHRLPDYYKAADVFVLPSRYEPFGIVMLEAMACALPVVSTRAGGPSKVIDPGIDGLLVDPADTDEMADGIATLLMDGQMRRRLGAAARAKVKRDYSWRAIAVRHRSIYEGGADAR